MGKCSPRLCKISSCGISNINSLHVTNKYKGRDYYIFKHMSHNLKRQYDLLKSLKGLVTELIKGTVNVILRDPPFKRFTCQIHNNTR